MAVTTPAPGGGTSSNAPMAVFGPSPQIFGVVNSASFKPGTITPGEIISIFGTGLGPAALALFNPAAPPIPVSLPAAGQATSVTIGVDAATVNSAQGPPGSVPGVLEISVVVPTTAPAGAAIPIVVNIGGVDSQANVTMAIK